MCTWVMEKPTIRTLMEAVPISKTYAAVILNGEQPPSRPLAIYIYRQTGWRHDLIRDLSDEQLDMFEAVEPWTPRKADAA